MLYILIGLYALYTLWELVLHILEFRFVKSKVGEQNVILSPDEYKNAGLSTLARLKFKCFSLAYGFLTLLFWLFIGLKVLNFFFEGTSLVGLFVCFLLGNIILSLPLEIYEKFVLDKKLGFSTITPRIFAVDTIKITVLTAVFGALGAMLFGFCYTYFSLWWFWGFLIAFGVILLINLIYPTIIAPIFNKMKPLENNELRDKITALLQSCGFKANGVFVMDASKRDNRLNAYFGGLGSSKRVVLFDTLIFKLSQNEIIAVLAHELGHFKHKDLLKNIVFMAFTLFIFFGVLGFLPFSVYGALGLEDSPISLLVFFFLFSPLLSAVFMPVASYFSRSHEFGADSFGSQLGGKENMISALMRLGAENKAFPLSHKLYSAFYHSHPSLFERINALQNR